MKYIIIKYNKIQYGSCSTTDDAAGRDPQAAAGDSWRPPSSTHHPGPALTESTRCGYP